jgi:vacuolar protein sorting-associated protein 54
MLRDVDYFVGRLGKVEGFGDLGTYLIKIIESKEIKSALFIDSPPAPTQATKEEKGKSDENTEPPIEK